MPQVTPYHIPPLWHLFKSPSHPVEPWPPRPREQSLKRRGAWRRPKQGVSLGAKVRWSLLSKNIPLNVRLFDTSRWTTNSHKESQGKKLLGCEGKASMILTSFQIWMEYICKQSGLIDLHMQIFSQDCQEHRFGAIWFGQPPVPKIVGRAQTWTYPFTTELNTECQNLFQIYQKR